MNVALYSSEWESCDKHAYAEVKAVTGDDVWPAMVSVEINGIGGDSVALTLTVDDAEELAARIGAAASSADFAMRFWKANRV